MGEIDRALIEELKQRFPADLVLHIRQIILYGSRARGDEDADSDLEPVVSLKLEEGREFIAAIKLSLGMR